jgi:hypothetical protein
LPYYSGYLHFKGATTELMVFGSRTDELLLSTDRQPR